MVFTNIGHKMRHNYITILNIIRPNLKFKSTGLKYEDIIFDGGDVPSKEELDNAIQEYNRKELDAMFRVERNYRLQECDWIVLTNYEKGLEVPSEWVDYRQRLRDLSGDSAEYGYFYSDMLDLDSIDWPERPEYAKRNLINSEDGLNKFILEDQYYLVMENSTKFDNENSRTIYPIRSPKTFPRGTLK